MPLFKRSLESPFDVPDQWHVLQGAYDGRPMLVRVQSGLEKAAGHPEFGTQIGVAIPLNSPRDDGFPTAEEDRVLGTIEERLHEDLEVPRRAVLAAVITTNGMREFVYYAQLQDWVMEWARAFDESTPSHAIQVMARSDPKWDVYRRLTAT